jgi:hypothetical protein
MLLLLILSPLIGAIIIFFIRRSNFSLIRNFALGWSLTIFNISVYFLLSAPFCAHYARWLNNPTWFSLITIKAIDLSEPSNGSLVRKDRGVQHVDKSRPGAIQHAL